MKKASSLKIATIGLGVALNIIGAFIALNLRLPILLDSIGTIMVSFIIGPLYGVTTGLLGSFVSGITFDIYSLYFAPVQLFVGLISGLLYKKGMFKGLRIPISVLIISIFSSLIGAVIAAYVFDGVTSSGSSYIVAFLKNIGVNKVVSVFVVQFLIDYADRFLSCLVTLTAVSCIPYSIKERIIEE